MTFIQVNDGKAKSCAKLSAAWRSGSERRFLRRP